MDEFADAEYLAELNKNLQAIDGIPADFEITALEDLSVELPAFEGTITPTATASSITYPVSLKGDGYIYCMQEAGGAAGRGRCWCEVHAGARRLRC